MRPPPQVPPPMVEGMFHVKCSRKLFTELAICVYGML